MRFEELPENWTTLPLDDAPLAAGVIDLVLGYRDRLNDSLLVLPCDQSDIALPTPAVIGGVRWTESDADRRAGLQFMTELPVSGFVVALSSRRRLPGQLVRGWLRTVEDLLDCSGHALLAFGVADSDTVEIVGGRATRNGSLGAAAG